jgi:uncharacterized protein YyaL (SSP411 family)
MIMQAIQQRFGSGLNVRLSAWGLIGGGFKLSAADRVTEPARRAAVARTGAPAAAAGRRSLLDRDNGPVCSDPTVYVCENRVCKLSTNQIEETKRILDAKSAVS